MIEALGSLGALLLALCGLPQAIKAVRDGHAHGLSWGLLSMWLGGEVLTLLYVCVRHPDVILIINYAANIVLLLVLVRYKVRPLIVVAPIRSAPVFLKRVK